MKFRAAERCPLKQTAYSRHISKVKNESSYTEVEMAIVVYIGCVCGGGC